MEQDKKCKDRVKSHLTSRMSDLRKLYKAWCAGNEYVEDLGILSEYGLCFDYVPAETFSDQKIGFFRFQISYGGPTEEIRFFTDSQFNLVEAQFWLLDWFDGAKQKFTGKRFEFISELYENYFREPGSVEHAYRKALS